MRIALCESLGIDLPIVAFSHCRDVVAAVTNAGGLGVLGVQTFSPDQLDRELAWIDQHVNGRPYGADVIIPGTYQGKGTGHDQQRLLRAITREHRSFVGDLLATHGLTQELDDGFLDRAPTVREGLGEELMDVILGHPVALAANALGVPPPFMIERAHEAGVPVAALVGSREHALRQVAAGVDILVAQGTEAGGHTGEVSTMVLVPEVVEAVRESRPVPVLAAGGIVTGRQVAAAIALGADGAWTGSVWLTTTESDLSPLLVGRMLEATSGDTVRSTARTGKPARQLASDWTRAWNRGDAPASLPMPVQGLLAEPVLRAVDAAAGGGHDGARELATYFVGQGVGLMREVRSVREVMREMAQDFGDAWERLRATVEELP